MASIATRTTSHGKRRYVARFRTPTGVSRQQWFDRKVDAEQFLISIEAAKQTGDFADPRLGRKLFGTWWKAWTGTRVDLRPSTIARDDSYYRNHIETTFGDVALGRIDRTMLREWVAGLTASGLAPATVAKAAQLVSKALAAAVDERLIARNPAERLPLPRIESHEMKFCTPAEVVTLADTIDDRFRVFVLTAAYSGLRLGELAGLRRGRVDFLRRRIDVAEIITEVRGELFEGPPKTRAGRRSVPIPEAIADELTTWCAGMEPGDLVFPAAHGGPLRAGLFRRRYWTPACVSAGLGEVTDGHYSGLRIHDLRHTAVTLWIAAGADPKQVATWAGHSSVVTVLDRYGHLLPGHEDKVVDALETMFRAAQPTTSATVSQLHK